MYLKRTPSFFARSASSMESRINLITWSFPGILLTSVTLNWIRSLRISLRALLSVAVTYLSMRRTNMVRWYNTFELVAAMSLFSLKVGIISGDDALRKSLGVYKILYRLGASTKMFFGMMPIVVVINLYISSRFRMLLYVIAFCGSVVHLSPTRGCIGTIFVWLVRLRGFVFI